MFKQRPFNEDVYKEDWQWQEGEYTVTRTTQWSGPGCHDGCGVLFYTKDGKLEKVEGDPRSPYFNGRLCMRCLDLVEAVNHPDRILYPLRRKGERGENSWERITWDEALDIIADKVHEYTEKYGSHSIVALNGTGRNCTWHNVVIPNTIFESPNSASGFLSGEACYGPRVMIANAMCGAPLILDAAQMYEEGYNHPEWQAPEYIVVWACNPLASNADGFVGHWIVDLMKQGSKLIVVDPQINWLAGRAEIWLQLRPGTDGALALAWLNVIINEDLYNHEFVEKWTYGFEALEERVQEWTPERAGEIAGVNPEKIRRAARAFAQSRVSSVQWGLPLDQQKHGIAAAQAIVCISAICGFIDVPGGNILASGGNSQYQFRTELLQLAPEWARQGYSDQTFGYKEFPIRAYRKAGPLSDMVLQALETDEPYPIKMAYISNNNFMANMAAEVRRVYEAAQKLEFVVCADLFMTPTITALADIVLPVAMSCERNSVRNWWAPLRTMTKVIQSGEAKSDEEIVRLLGKKLQPEKFPWNSDIEMLDWLMANMYGDGRGTKFAELEKKVYQYSEWNYRKHEKGLLRKDGEPGFATSTGLIELFVSVYDYYGAEPLPYYEEPTESPLSTPELMEEFPFVLSTGRRMFEYFHSEHRQLKHMRIFHPDPLCYINPEDAEPLGIKDGDWVWLQNIHGKCKQRARVTPGMKKGVIQGEHGWWFPERDGYKDGGFFGCFESNINNLTTQCDVGPLGMAAPYKTQICKVYRVTPENDNPELTPEEEARARAARLNLALPTDVVEQDMSKFNYAM